MDYKKAFKINQETWDKKVAVHAASDFYDVEGFKKGASSLHAYEINALGDVTGKTLLHLQCHFGQDTLSWSRMGAACTGIDISGEAIELARSLNKELSQDAKFVQCNVLETSRYVTDTFDIVFTSYGTIGWLPDLRPWARMISERLKPEGVFYIVDFHPIAWMFDYTVSPPRLAYGYQQKEVIYEEYEGTYADTDSQMISKEYGWNHGLSEVITSLIAAGLSIELCREYDESPYDIFPGLIQTAKSQYTLPNKLYPLLFEIRARKKT